MNPEEPISKAPVAMAGRFPAAHQYLRMRLLDEIFPIAPSLSCLIEPTGEERWLVRLAWPVIDFLAEAAFPSDDLRRVYGPWSTWARAQVFEIADRLPV